MATLSTAQPAFLFRIDRMKQNPDVQPRIEGASGAWRPPRPLGSNMRISEGSWIYHRGRENEPSFKLPPDRAARIFAENRYVAFRTFSMYFADGSFWIVPYDATLNQVGDGMQRDNVGNDENHQDTLEEDKSDDEPDDLLEDWSQLSFTRPLHRPDEDVVHAFYASYHGQNHRLPPQPEAHEAWGLELLPDRYRPAFEHRTWTNDQLAGFGGLVGDLPIVLGLLAFSLKHREVDDFMPQCVHGHQWKLHGLRQTRGWIYQRGIVIRTCAIRDQQGNTSESPLRDFERGRFGKIYSQNTTTLGS